MFLDLSKYSYHHSILIQDTCLQFPTLVGINWNKAISGVQTSNRYWNIITAISPSTAEHSQILPKTVF